MSDTTHTEDQSTVLQTTREFFDALDITPEIGVDFDPETEYYTVQLDTENPGLLIGYRGDTLSAIQYYLAQTLRTATGDWVKLIVNVGNYREQRQETLEQLALNAAKRVEFSGEPYIFTNLTPPERRVIHLTLQDHPKVVTESTGDGRNRQLSIVPR